MKHTIIIILALAAFIFSCGDSPTTAEVKEEVATQETVAVEEEEHDHDHEHDGIVLNDGEKWEVVEHMMAHIQNMESDISAFDGKSIAEYKTLSAAIDKNLDLLTSNCTMTGQAHDELHKWLLPYIDLTTEFAAAETAKEASESFQQIKTSFGTFSEFFK